jgi:ribosome biogenesis GTPase / thiamine phosphate phosphatase
LLYDHRIASDRGSLFLALDAGGLERTVSVLPSLERPAVGDYVALDADGRIAAIAPRRGVLARARSDRGNVAQIVAAHLDVVFIVTAPGREFSPPRVERYLTAALAGGIAPVIVLNKCDIADDLAALCADLAAVAGDIPVHTISATTGDGCATLLPYLREGVTLAVVGSSGVGKSTLANRLLGEDRLEIGATRASDGRGKHTTTSREMITLPGGAWLIDTPGMRAFAPWADEAALSEAFSDIESASRRCRFRDCAHGSEPGCAVNTEIDERRVTRWRALQAELAYLDRRDDRALHAAEKKRWKQITKANRSRYREERE